MYKTPTTYHSCGHPSTPERFPNAEKIARVLCPSCRAAYHQQNEAARSESASRGLPTIRGKSPRQVEWATTIRIEMLRSLEERLAGQEWF